MVSCWVGVGQQPERLVRVVGDEVDPRSADLGKVRLGLVERLLAGIGRADRALRGAAAEGVDAEAQDADDDHEGQDRQGSPALRLPARGERGDAAIGRLPSRHQVLEPCDGALDCATGGDPCAPRGRTDRDPGRLDVVRERDRRAVRGAGERLGRADRDEGPGAAGRRHLGRLEGDRPVAARAVGGHEPVVEMLHRRLRVERQHRVLELVRPELGDDVGRHQDERIADRDLAAPDLRLDRARRQAALAMRIRQGRQACLADQVGLGRPDRRDVHLAAADDRDADADRPVAVGLLSPSRSAWWASRLLAVAIAFWRQTRIPADSS